MRSSVSAVSRTRWFLALVGTVGLVAIATAVSRKRRNPAACPYALRVFLQVPRPFMSRERVMGMVDPVPGQRVLEIGPGVGYYSLDLAAALAPGGSLDLLDIQAPMLQTVMQRAGARGVGGITPHLGDAQASPFPDATFDAVLAVATLGEIPDHAQALEEMHRVLKPSGHLIIGEGQPDPHMVTRAALTDLARTAGFTIAQWEGNALGYVARLVPRSAS
jgi:ubiquinone/menaquinone biosynthesis C-methylase UbiE